MISARPGNLVVVLVVHKKIFVTIMGRVVISGSFPQVQAIWR